MRERLRGFAVLLYGAISMVFFFVVSLPIMAISRSGEFPMWLARRAWGPSALRVAGTRIDAHPAPPLPEGPLIFASNHESALDIWIHLAHLPRSFRFLAKQELFRIPVLGWYLRIGGHIPVDRQNRTRAVESLRRAADAVRAGTSLVVYPEGTRSGDGRVLPFKKGPFVVAAEAGVPVVPVAISGSGRVTPTRRIAVAPGTIRMAIGEPVDPRQHPGRDALLVEVRRRIIELHRSIGGAGGDVGDAIPHRDRADLNDLPAARRRDGDRSDALA